MGRVNQPLLLLATFLLAFSTLIEGQKTSLGQFELQKGRYVSNPFDSVHNHDSGAGFRDKGSGKDGSTRVNGEEPALFLLHFLPIPIPFPLPLPLPLGGGLGFPFPFPLPLPLRGWWGPGGFPGGPGRFFGRRGGFPGGPGRFLGRRGGFTGGPGRFLGRRGGFPGSYLAKHEAAEGKDEVRRNRSP